MKKYKVRYSTSGSTTKIDADSPTEAYKLFLKQTSVKPITVVIDGLFSSEFFDDHVAEAEKRIEEEKTQTGKHPQESANVDKELQKNIIEQEKLQLEEKKAEEEKTTTKPTPEKSATISSAPEGITSMKNPYIIPSLIIAAAILIGVWILKDSNEKSQNQLIQQIQDKKSGEQVEEVQEKESLGDAALRFAREMQLDINVRERKIRPSDVASGFYCKHGYFDINGKFGKAECYHSHD